MPCFGIVLSYFCNTNQKQLTMKIAIVGSRTFQDYDLMCEFIECKLSDMEFNSVEAVVSGGARGADSLAE